MALVDTLVAAIPLLGILVFIHEFGHFIVAKACGVRVLKFSIGFGAPIGFGDRRMRWVRGGTEYVVGWIPLGGFVRMLGEQLPGDDGDHSDVPADARPDEFLEAKPTWQKLSISFAGPAMNLLFPVVAFSIMLFAGIPKTSSVVGLVESGSPAEIAGLRAGDTLVAVDGVPVRFWEEVAGTVATHEPGPLGVEVLRAGERVELAVAVGQREALDEFGDVDDFGWIGISPRRLPALLGIIDTDGPAAGAGLRSGDLVIAVAGKDVEDWEALRLAYAVASAEARANASSVPLTIGRGGSAEATERVIDVPALADLDSLAVVSANILIGEVVPGLPADEAGLAPGDLILTVDGVRVGSFESFASLVRASGGRSLAVGFARDGALDTAQLSPRLREVAHPLEIEGMEQQVYQIGIRHALATLPGVPALDRDRNPFTAVPRAFVMTVNTARIFLKGLGKLASGDVGTDQLSGPIGIAEIARKSLDRGWQVYLFTMIFISLNLGFLNLLPIPILDGGQILIFAIEGIKRSPISARTREITQQIGFIFLVMLMGLAFFNDLSRQWAQFIKWLNT